jgi:hypothetical protein
MYGLAKGLEAKRKQGDNPSGPLPRSHGMAKTIGSPEFDRVGMYAPFGEDAAKNPGYFEEWTARHLAGPGMNFGPQPGPSA